MNFESDQKRVAFGYQRNENDDIVLHGIKSAIVESIFIFYDQGSLLQLKMFLTERLSQL